MSENSINEQNIKEHIINERRQFLFFLGAAGLSGLINSACSILPKKNRNWPAPPGPALNDI